MKLVIVVALVAILAIGYSAKADVTIHGNDGFGPDDESNIKKLAPHFVKLSKILRKKLEQNPEIRRTPERIMDLAREELGANCVGACLNPSRRKALKLFLGLENTLRTCTAKSFHTLAKNRIAHQAVEYPYSQDDITSIVLKYYRIENADHCRPVHKQMFAAQVKHVSSSDMKMLERAFSTLDISDFGYDEKYFKSYMSRFDLVGMHKPEFADHNSRKALKKIADQLKGPKQAAAEKLGHWLDVQLFEPCKNYRKQLGLILDAARFDAAIKDGEPQREFIHGDEKFHRAMIINRMCASLLDEQNILYRPFRELASF